MTETPPPPNYPPNSAWTEPEIHVHFAPEPAEESRWDFSWIQPWTNTWTATLAFVPASLWASVIHDVHEVQSLGGAWFMAGAGLAIAVARFVQKRSWPRRTLVWIAVLGAFLSLPVFSTLVDVMTGGAR
ncbi:hypothetical protein AB0I87_13475 [Streptomyces sp. NPDC049952]|uniref:hypothetical protein n=1 Tax=Streptomyces sp. NPDC049952 TaxID=3156665 RepID=UPI00341580B2